MNTEPLPTHRPGEGATNACFLLEPMDVDELLASGKAVYDLLDAPFGILLIAGVGRQLVFASVGSTPPDAVSVLSDRFPGRHFTSAPGAYQELAGVFSGQPLSSSYHLCVKGTPFQIAVWQTLLQIPAGSVTTYSAVAASAGYPKAVRATGSAIGRNPIAVFIPCHRVVPAGGGLGGYYWGEEMKRKLINGDW